MILKKYLIPILLATIAGVLISWWFDDFSKQNPAYFVKLFFKCMVIPLVIVIVLNMKKPTK